MRAVRIKICCIQSRDETEMALAHGAAALGLVSEMPSGPGVIPESRIIEIAAAIPPGVGSFLLTSRTDAPSIVAQQRRCAVNTLQLCDRPQPGTHESLRRDLPGIGRVQVVHVTGEDSIAEAQTLAPHVDALLLDSGDPSAAVKELGGTGRVHNWEWSRRICQSAGVPVFLAGGLNATNVARAIEVVRPYAVDVCSGVRTKGALDVAKLRDFVDAAHGAAGA